jgi:hypothetical protein
LCPDGGIPVLHDAGGDEHCTVPETAVDGDFSESGIEDEVRGRSQRSVLPGVKARIEFRESAADLGSGNTQSTQLEEDLLETARANALDMHLRQSE